MTLPELAKRLRTILSNSMEDQGMSDFINLLDEEILNISALENEAQQRRDFEEELQVIYDEDVDFGQLESVEIFLEVLTHVRAILPATTIIANWFELLLRPALREPKLRPTAVENAKLIVVEGLEDDRHNSELCKNFRRRLIDLFLLDAFDESSSKDILEWAQLDEAEKTKTIWWKSNLGEILIRYGLSRPEELLDVMQDCFAAPSSRLQIVTLLDSLAAEPSFLDVAPAVFTHPFMGSIYRSLEVDNSSTVCAVELAVVVKLLPAAAIKAYEPLKDILPRLHGILGRVLCWKTRVGQVSLGERAPYSDLMVCEDKALVAEMERRELDDETEDLKETWQAKLAIREELNWKRLERSFDLSTTSLPVPRQFLALLYFLFPCNTINFLRNPTAYLQDRNVESPWTVEWEEALDDLQIRTAGSTLLRSQISHPSILWHDASSELRGGDRWSDYDVSRIVGECMMLDRETAVSSVRSGDPQKSYTTPYRPMQRLPRSGDITTTQTPTVRNISLEEHPPRPRKISLHDLIVTSAALKSGADISVSEKAPSWPSILFTPPPSTLPSNAPSRSSSVDPDMNSASPTSEIQIPTQISETIAGLQREVLLLRTELNFELWLKRENVRHIHRLHREDVLAKSAEVEQQRLQERLREYRSQLLELQKESKKQQDQALSLQKQTTEWNEQLKSKLDDLREQKKAWQREETVLRGKSADLEARLAAQGRLLDEAHNRVFLLEAAIKTDAPKVDRLRDYEKRIEQLTAILRMWNNDITDYNEQAKEMKKLLGEYEKMKMRVDAYEQSLKDADNAAEQSRRRMQRLEAQLSTAKKRTTGLQSQDVVQMLAEQARDRDRLARNNSELRRENEQLTAEKEELEAMVEELRAKTSGTVGLISPLTYVSA